MEDQSTILIIDDESIARDVLEGYLAKEGYNLAFAATGEEALAHMEEQLPDIILLDVMMPDLDGFTLCRQFKSDLRWQHIPVIMVTVLKSRADLLRGFEAGTDDFLHKPVDAVELRARVRSLLRIKKQHDELQAAINLREELVQMMMHDMRTPLTVIRGYSAPSMLQYLNDPHEYLEYFARIHTQAQRLETFLNDMLLLAKMEAGQLSLQRSLVDVPELTRQLEQLHCPIAQTKKIDLLVEVPAKSYQILIDPNLFQRALDNLIANAIKFSPTQSTVTLRVQYRKDGAESRSAASQIRFLVLDEGPGIPAEDRERIFNKYEIVTLKKEDSLQVGLGLAFCKMVVEAHGGCIFVEANKPQGAIFTVEI
jgi:signal transduction histidine kinase